MGCFHRGACRSLTTSSEERVVKGFCSSVIPASSPGDTKLECLYREAFPGTGRSIHPTRLGTRCKASEYSHCRTDRHTPRAAGALAEWRAERAKLALPHRDRTIPEWFSRLNRSCLHFRSVSQFRMQWCCLRLREVFAIHG